MKAMLVLVLATVITNGAKPAQAEVVSICPYTPKLKFDQGRCQRIAGAVLCSETENEIYDLTGVGPDTDRLPLITEVAPGAPLGGNSVPTYDKVSDAIANNGPGRGIRSVFLPYWGGPDGQADIIGPEGAGVTIVYFFEEWAHSSYNLTQVIREISIYGVTKGNVAGCNYYSTPNISTCNTGARPNRVVLVDFSSYDWGATIARSDDSLRTWCNMAYGCEYVDGCVHREYWNDTNARSDIGWKLLGWAYGLCKLNVSHTADVIGSGSYLEIRQISRSTGGFCNTSIWAGNAEVVGLYGDQNCGFITKYSRPLLSPGKKMVPVNPNFGNCTSCNFPPSNRRRREVEAPPSWGGHTWGYCTLICFGAGPVDNPDDGLEALDKYWTDRMNEFGNNTRDELLGITNEVQITRSYVNDFMSLERTLPIDELKAEMDLMEDQLRRDFMEFDNELKRFLAIVKQDRIDILILQYNLNLVADYYNSIEENTLNLVWGNYHKYTNGCISFDSSPRLPELTTESNIENTKSDTSDNTTSSTDHTTLPPVEDPEPAPIFTPSVNHETSVAEILLWTDFALAGASFLIDILVVTLL